MSALEDLANAYYRARYADPRVIRKIRISWETERNLLAETDLFHVVGYNYDPASEPIAYLFGVPVEVVDGLEQTEFVR